MRTALDFGIWLLAILVFVLSFFVDLKAFAFLKKDEVQLVLGVLVVAVLLFVDATVGLLLGLALLVIFYRTHSAMMASMTSWKGHGRDGDFLVTMEDYVTPEHLARAQSNTFSEENMRAKMIGIKGPYGEPVWDAQGAYDALPGKDQAAMSAAPIQ